MAEQEERIAALEESLVQQQAASITLLGIVKGIDTKQSEQSAKLREIGLTVDHHTKQMDFLQSQNAAILAQLAWVIELLKKKGE